MCEDGRVLVEFECRRCHYNFEVAWTFGDNVTCPYCQATWETDYETNIEDNISGPWLENQVE